MIPIDQPIDTSQQDTNENNAFAFSKRNTTTFYFSFTVGEVLFFIDQVAQIRFYLLTRAMSSSSALSKMDESDDSVINGNVAVSALSFHHHLLRSSFDELIRFDEERITILLKCMSFYVSL